jgi:UV DNA damage endonuclease
MDNIMSGKIGFCCIKLDTPNKNSPEAQYKTATVSFVSKMKQSERLKYIQNIVFNNLQSLHNIVSWLGNQPEHLRMYRITSGLLPLATHETCASVYNDNGFKRDIENALKTIGSQARDNEIALSFHPGQFVVLNSAKENVRKNSIQEFELHIEQARMMGYSKKDNFCSNVHGGAWHNDTKTSLESWDWSWKRLSADAKSMITLENDELAWKTRSILQLCNKLNVRMVFDVHHHWARTDEWLDSNHDLLQSVKQTWDGKTPKIHVSLPHSRFFNKMDKPLRLYQNFDQKLFETPDNTSVSKLRPHSNWLWHPGIAQLLLSYYRKQIQKPS